MNANERPIKALSVRLTAMVLTSSLIVVLAMGCAGDYARKRAEHYYLQGQSLANRGETERAARKFEKSMYLAEKTGFTAGIAHNLNELAIIHTNQGEFDKARAKLNEALKIYRSLKGMDPEISKTMNNLAQTYYKEGMFEETIEHYKKLIIWDEKTGNRIGMASTLGRMAMIYERYMGDPQKARTAREWALEILREPGNEKYLKQLQNPE